MTDLITRIQAGDGDNAEVRRMTWGEAMWAANLSVARCATASGSPRVPATGETHDDLVRLTIALHRAVCRAVVQSWSHPNVR